MNRKSIIATFVLAAALTIFADVPAFAASFSQFWKQTSDGSWYIESDEGKWIVLPEQYDTTYLFTIQTSVG